MSSIVVDPKNPAIIAANPPPGVKAGAGNAVLSIGEVLSAAVLDQIAEGKYLLAVKNLLLSASSQLPLRAGDRLDLKVVETKPQVILTLLDPSKIDGQSRIREGLVNFRANPDGLLSVFSKINEFASIFKSDPLLTKIAGNEIQALVNRIGSLILSPRTRTDSMFVKNFVETSGLMFESVLKDLAVAGSVKSASALTGDLKSLLLTLSGRVAGALKSDAALPIEIRNVLQNLALFTAEAVKALEARQIVNVSYQQSDQGLYLQIPVGQGDGLRRADVFIRPDAGNEQRGADFSDCSITIFLDMEYLGTLSIEARLRQGNFRCVISCQDDQARLLIDSQVNRLYEALGNLGYHVEGLACLVSPDLEQKRNEFIAAQIFSDEGLINFFV